MDQQILFHDMAGRPGAVQLPGNVKDQLPNIKKLIMEAQTLDDNGDELVSRRRTGTDSADCMIKDAPPLAVFKLP